MIAGVELETGRAALAEVATEIWWRAQSSMLCAGCAVALPGFRFQQAREPPSHSATRAARRVGFAFVRDTGTEAWAREAGVRLLMPKRRLALEVGDKLALEGIAAEAGVRVPASVAVPATGSRDADRLWEELGGRPVVAQLPDDGLTGAGTVAVHSREELAHALRRWHGRRLKLSELLDGTPITASGWVGPKGAVVSGLSHQLVGFPALAPGWAAHCGNQLLQAGDLPKLAVEAAIGACRALGEAIGARGYRGMFGVDAIVGDGVAAIEINPRIQTVSSLVGIAEIEAGLLPTQGAHLLAHALDSLPPLGEPAWPGRRLSQVVVYATAPARVVASLAPGAYALDDDAPVMLSPAAELRAVDGEKALVWPFVKAGDRVSPGSRLAVIQLGRHLAPVGPGRQLKSVGERWAGALRRALCASATAEQGAL